MTTRHPASQLIKRDTKPDGCVMRSVTKNVLYMLCHYAGRRYAECPVPVKY